MNCPVCHKGDIRVMDSRSTRIRIGRNAVESPAIRRRRKCIACEHSWTTYEVEEGTWMGHKGDRSIGNVIGQARRRGFIVPPSLRDEYYKLKAKRMTANEAAMALGIMDEDGTVKRKFLPPSPKGG